MEPSEIIAVTRRWIQKFVIGLDLCPFAQKVFDSDAVYYHVSTSKLLSAHLESLMEICHKIDTLEDISTGFLILPFQYPSFEQFLDFCDRCNWLLEDCRLSTQYQLASFHPEYLFKETEQDDPANYTNRAPYAMIHILKVEDVSRAIHSYPDIDQVPIRNTSKLRSMGVREIKKHWG